MPAFPPRLQLPYRPYPCVFPPALFYTSFEWIYDQQLQIDTYIGGHHAINPVLAGASTGAFFTIGRAPNTIALATAIGGIGMGTKILGEEYLGWHKAGSKRGIFF